MPSVRASAHSPICLILIARTTPDLAAEHAMGGVVGLLFNGFFADANLAALDGVTSIPGGWLNGNWKQLYIQFAYVCATIAYTFVMTALLAMAFDLIPCLKLRASPEEEALGMDDTQVCLSSLVFFPIEDTNAPPLLFRLANSFPIMSRSAATTWIGHQSTTPRRV